MELKPCPFGCAGQLRTGESFKSIHLFTPTDKMDCWYVSCLECDCDGPPCGTQEDAIAAWNKRPGEEVRERALEDAWNAVNALIKHGQLPEKWQRDQRNGYILATNEIMKLRGRAPLQTEGEQ